MRGDWRGRNWARQGMGLLVVGILAGACATRTAAQQGNRVIDGDAAAIGQRTPGPTSRPDIPAMDGSVRYANPDSTKAEQQRELREMRFDKIKEHASQLAEMARSLQEEVEDSNQNILSVKVIEEAKKIEKLARKIRSEAQY
jgi:hypothetical protein